jgi:hypothetical protein
MGGAKAAKESGFARGIDKKDELGASKVFFPKDKSKSKSFPEMTDAERAEAMVKLFGEGTYSSRAAEALPGILERLQMQRIAQLQNVPTLGVLPTVQGGQISGLGQMAMPQQGFLQSLATQGMGQISQGQAMNPTILKAKV